METTMSDAHAASNESEDLGTDATAETTPAKKAARKTRKKVTSKKATGDADSTPKADASTKKKTTKKKTTRKTAAPSAETGGSEETTSPVKVEAATTADEPTTKKKSSTSRRRKKKAEAKTTATTEDHAAAEDGAAVEDTASAEPETETDSDTATEDAPKKKSRRRRGGRRRKGESADVDASEGGEASDAEGESDASDAENDTEAGEDTEPAAKDDGKSEKKPRRTRERRWPDRAAIEVTPTGPRAEKGSRLMLVDEVPGESCRIAILEKGRLEELFVERAQSSTAVGNIYKARVVNVESAIQAAFVDYGEGMNGFLHVSDLHPRYFPGGDKTEKVGRKTPRRERPPIQEALKKGQEILVQVLKQGIGTKGPTVTSYLSIPGRLMVMMPGMDRVGVSRKVDDEQRDKMRKILDQLELPEGFGFILRTAGYDRTKAELKRDVSYLRRLWDQLEKRMSKVGAPSELYTEGDLLVRTIRDVVDDSIGSIVVNSETGFERAKTFLEVIAPSSSPIVRHYDDAVPLFDAFGVEPQIDMIHAREVPLKSGGALVIDQTEAMVAIDVNSGRSRGAKDAESNAVTTNREAVDEIARQLRLRDQGGLVVCDLIDMRFSRNRKEIEERLAANLAKDRARTTFLPISEFGLVEMTRQRIRPSIRSQYFTPCPMCQGIGEIRNPDSVAADAVRRAARYLAIEQVHRIELVCGFRVASAILAGHRRRMDALERSSGGRIDIRISDQLPGDRFDVYAYDDRNADLDLGRLPKLKAPDPTSLPTEVLEPDDDDGDDTPVRSGGGGRRRRRRRKPAPADVVSIAMAGGFDDYDDEDDDDEILTGEDAAESGGDPDSDGDAGGRKRRRRRRRRRGRGGAGEDGAVETTETAEVAAEPEPPAEPVRVHEMAKVLDIKSREILDAVAERLPELELKGAMSWIPAEHVATVRGFVAPEPEPTPEPEVADEAADVNGVTDDANATGDMADDGDDAPKKKRRRRRRRGGRKHRRDEDGEVDGERPGDADSTDESDDDEEDEVASAEVASEPTSSESEADASDDEPAAPIVETTPAPKPKRRRSLYGGRFQRLSVPPESSDDR
jgi:ribonuclease E